MFHASCRTLTTRHAKNNTKSTTSAFPRQTKQHIDQHKRTLGNEQLQNLRHPHTSSIQLTRIQHSQSGFASVAPTHITELEQTLQATSANLVQTTQDALKAHFGPTPGKIDSLSVNLERLAQRVRDTPVHIGFICNKNFFDCSGNFWPSARYYNKAQWRQHSGPAPLGSPALFSSPAALPHQADKPALEPIYGALNLGLRGHSGWGASCFVLKPGIAPIELRSRDTGDPSGTGLYALTCTPNYPLTLVSDWIRTKQINMIWQALTADEREQFVLPAHLNVETAIYTRHGFIQASDIALIFISLHEASQASVDLSLIRQRGHVHGVPVIFHHYPETDIPFDSFTAYQKVMADYAQSNKP